MGFSLDCFTKPFRISRIDSKFSRSMATVLLRDDLYYPELSYQIMGAAFGVHTELGPRYHEKHYQRALALALRARGIPFKEQVPVQLTVRYGPIGKYAVDFLVDDKIVVEIKAIKRFTKTDFRQVDAYLRSLHRPLGILMNFQSRSLAFKRIVNPDFAHHSS